MTSNLTITDEEAKVLVSRIVKDLNKRGLKDNEEVVISVDDKPFDVCIAKEWFYYYRLRIVLRKPNNVEVSIATVTDPMHKPSYIQLLEKLFETEVPFLSTNIFNDEVYKWVAFKKVYGKTPDEVNIYLDLNETS